MKGLLTTTISIMMLITFLLPGCTPHQEEIFGFNPVLSISELPDLGKPVILTLTFTTVAIKGYDSDRLSYCARFLLPPGFYNVLEGSTEVIGSMGAPGQTKSVQITVESLKTGDASIDAVAEVYLDGKFFGSGGFANTIHVTITDDGESFYGGQQPTSDAPIIKSLTGGGNMLIVPELDFRPDLSISAPPKLGIPVQVTFSFTPVIPNYLEGKQLSYKAQIELAPGA